MAPRYSIELGRWIDDDEDGTDMQFAVDEANDPYSDNPYDSLDAPTDMDIPESETEPPAFRMGEVQGMRAREPEPMPPALDGPRMMGENPRLPERHPELSNEETLPYNEKAQGLGPIDVTGRIPKPPAWDTTSLDEARRLDAGGQMDLPEEDPYAPAAPALASSRQYEQTTQPDRNPEYPVKPSELRHTSSTEQVSDADTDGGVRRDPMGIETENPDSAEAKMRRVAELYKARYGNETAPEETPYQPYQEQGHRQTDGDLQRMWILNAIGGGPDQAFKAAELHRGLNQDYDRRNQQGRQDHLKNWIAERDARASTGHLSQAEMQQAVAAGWATPEAVMDVRRGSGFQKAGGQLGAISQRERATDAKLIGKEIDVAADAAEQKRKQDFEGRMAGAADITKRRGQDQNMRLLEAKQAQAKDVSRPYKVSTIMETADVDQARAEDIANGGDISDLRPSVQNKLKSTMLQNEVIGTDTKAMVRGASQMQGNNARQKDALEAKALDPKENLRIRKEVTAAEQSLRDARDGVAELRKDPVALAAFVKLGSTGNLNELANFGRTPAQQQAARKIYAILNRTIREEGGKALSESEKEMYGAQSGVTLGTGTAVFRDPSVFIDYLKSLNRAQINYKKDITRSYGPEFWGQ